jgi:phage shock protein PspC (stress-responsive transcriptional regulator)
MWQRFKDFISTYTKTFVFIIVSAIIIGLGLYFEWDKDLVASSVVLIGIFSNAFAGLVSLIALVPFLGPFLIKIFSIPFFWLLNALGYFVSIFFVKRGYSKQVMSGRILTIVLLTGVVIGFVLGRVI